MGIPPAGCRIWHANSSYHTCDFSKPRALPKSNQPQAVTVGTACLGASWGQHQELPSPPSSPQTPSTSWRCLQHGSPYRFTHTPLSYRGASPSECWSCSLPVPRGLPAGCHVVPEPRCRSRWRSVSFRVAHLKFQLAGCFHAGGMQNQPTNTNKYLLYPPPPPPILVFILTSQLVLGGKMGFQSFP